MRNREQIETVGGGDDDSGQIAPIKLHEISAGMRPKRSALGYQSMKWYHRRHSHKSKRPMPEELCLGANTLTRCKEYRWGEISKLLNDLKESYSYVRKSLPFQPTCHRVLHYEFNLIVFNILEKQDVWYEVMKYRNIGWKHMSHDGSCFDTNFIAILFIKGIQIKLEAIIISSLNGYN